MPKVFITMVDYFEPDKWPILGFNRDTRLKKLVEQYDDGDVVFHIGRSSDNKYTENHGKILGAATFNTEKVRSVDFLHPAEIEEFKNKEGEFRWPVALVMKQAWVFDKKPSTNSIIKRHIPAQHVAVEAVRWGGGTKWGDEADAQALLSLLSDEATKAQVMLPNNQAELEKKEIRKPNIFLKKDFEFLPDSWPVIAFTTTGWAQNLADVYKDGDLILICGSGAQGNPYTKARNKLLGIAEIDTHMIDTFYYCDAKARGNRVNYRDGKFRWPYGFLIKRAHFFNPRYGLKWRQEISSENIALYSKSGTSISGFVQLKEEDAEAILNLATQEAIVGNPESDIKIKDDKVKKLSEAVKKPAEGWRSRAPTITARNAELRYDAVGTAYTYVFRFGNRNIWKIGCSQYLTRRLAEISKHVPDEVLSENWDSYLSQEHSSPQLAREMEQTVLDILEAKLTQRKFRGERVQCTEEELREAWDDAKNKFKGI